MPHAPLLAVDDEDEIAVHIDGPGCNPPYSAPEPVPAPISVPPILAMARYQILAQTSYRALSRATGISHTHVARVLRGETAPGLEVAAKLAAATGLTIDELHVYIETVKGGTDD